jgi:hypothetical protein
MIRRRRIGKEQFCMMCSLERMERIGKNGKDQKLSTKWILFVLLGKMLFLLFLIKT